jgi:hypothetical protein
MAVVVLFGNGLAFCDRIGLTTANTTLRWIAVGGIAHVLVNDAIARTATTLFLRATTIQNGIANGQARWEIHVRSGAGGYSKVGIVQRESANQCRFGRIVFRYHVTLDFTVGRS